MHPIVLEKRDPRKNMYRFYQLSALPNLLANERYKRNGDALAAVAAPRSNGTKPKRKRIQR